VSFPDVTPKIRERGNKVKIVCGNASVRISQHQLIQIELALSGRIRLLGRMFSPKWGFGLKAMASTAEVYAIVNGIDPHKNPNDKRKR